METIYSLKIPPKIMTRNLHATSKSMIKMFLKNRLEDIQLTCLKYNIFPHLDRKKLKC